MLLRQAAGQRFETPAAVARAIHDHAPINSAATSNTSAIQIVA